jgi:hypothetical protein
VPHSGGDGLTGGVGRTALGRDSQGRQGHGVDSSLTWAPANVSALNAHVEGAGTEAASPRGPLARRNLARGGVQPPREAEPHPRGATGPRARRNLTRGGVRPSSEAEPRSRRRPTLERGGSLLVSCRAPRVTRSSARGWLGHLSGGPPGLLEPWARPLGREFTLSVF